MLVKTRAIILHAIKYGESQLIVDSYTELYGRLSFIVRLSKSCKGKMKKQYFQPFMLLTIELDYRAKKSLQQLKDVGIACPLLSIPVFPLKATVVLFLAELLCYAIRFEQANARLFKFLYESVLWLDSTNSSIANFHIVFLVRLSYFLGIAPNLSVVNLDGYFDLQEGCFLENVPMHSHYLDKEYSLSLINLFRLDYDTMHLYSMTRKERKHCVEVIMEYYRLHIPDFPDVKSFAVLTAMFD